MNPFLKEKISPLIRFQFPEFIQTDYPVFIEFVRAYYEWMEQSGHAQEAIQNTLLYGDIDSTLDEFIEYFIREFYDTIPRTVLFDKKVLLKYINSLYSTKGSPRSYDLLFRILYDTDVETWYPKEKVFRASNGKWIRNVSIFLKISKGIPEDIEFKTVFIHAPDYSYQYKLEIERHRVAENTYGSDDVSEFFINDSTNIPINPGDVIEFDGFYAEVAPTPAAYKIIAPGTGFRVGDILSIQIDEGRRSRAKVIKVDERGGIRAIQFISFGVNYTDLEFYNYFSAKKSIPEKALYNMTDDAFVIEDVISRIYEDGIFFRSNYVRSAFRYDYVGEIVRQFKTEMGVEAFGDDSDAIIMIIPSGKAKYPGYYKSNDSFPSDDIYIQDYHFYQPFSYVLRVDEQLQNYKRAVLENIHPAGTKLFAEYLLQTDIVTGSEVEVTKEDIEKIMDLDLFFAYDEIVWDYHLISLDEIESIDKIVKHVEKIYFSSFDVEDDQRKYYIKRLYDEGDIYLDDWVFKQVGKYLDSDFYAFDDGLEYDGDVNLLLIDDFEIDDEQEVWNGKIIIPPFEYIVDDSVDVLEIMKGIYLEANRVDIEIEMVSEPVDTPFKTITTNDNVITLEVADTPLDFIDDFS